MADSKLVAHSTMTAAMAWRVKYRRTNHDGKILRLKVRVEALGVHPKSRGGVYPSGRRCVSLCEDVMDVGFVKEEMNTIVVAVEDTPAEHIRSRGIEYKSGSAYNITA